MKWIKALGFLVLVWVTWIPFLTLPPKPTDSFKFSEHLPGFAPSFQAHPNKENRHTHFQYGLRPVTAVDSNRVGFQDSNGVWKIAPRFSAAHPFNEGLAAVRIGDEEDPLWGFIDTTGQWRIDPLFHHVLHDFSEGIATVSLPVLTETPVIFIDTAGGAKFSHAFVNGLSFKNGKTEVQCGPATDLGKPYGWGVIDTSGVWLLPCGDPKAKGAFATH